MSIELQNAKWGSFPHVDGVEAIGHRRATEIISADATCSECNAAWTTAPSLDNLRQPGSFTIGSGVIEITCPNGHTQTMSLGPMQPDPR